MSAHLHFARGAMLSAVLAMFLAGCGGINGLRSAAPVRLELNELVERIVAGVKASPPGQEMAAAMAVPIPYEGDGFFVDRSRVSRTAAIYMFEAEPCLDKATITAAMTSNGFKLRPNLRIYTDGYDPRQLMMFEMSLSKGLFPVHFEFDVAHGYHCAAAMVVDPVDAG